MPTPPDPVSQPGRQYELSDAERQAIAERIAFELHIRRELEARATEKDKEEDTKKRKPLVKEWLESSFVLLLLGSAITGVLVPYWQQQQETVKWQRENQHENFQYRLTQMRQCLQDFLNLTAFPSDANEIAKPVLANASLRPQQFDQFAAQFRDLQQKRFHETTKVLSLFIHFPRPDRVSAVYERYTQVIAQFMDKLDALARETRELGSRKGSSPANWRDLETRSQDMGADFKAINTLFDQVVAEIHSQIKEVEHESERLK